MEIVSKPAAYHLNNHLAVRLKDCILVLSKSAHIQNQCLSTSFIFSFKYTIWLYNLWTEQWRKYAFPKQKEPPEALLGQTGVAIGNDIYYFGGNNHKNMLRKLTRNVQGSFVWSIIHTEDQTKVPSPRLHHCAWEHDNKMWVFGGKGQPTDDYLNDHGHFIPYSFNVHKSNGKNNQLLSYDPSTKTWINVKCSGEVPSPRHSAFTARMQDNVWLYGGKTGNLYSDNLYELNMRSFTWTKIEANMTGPNGGVAVSLTPISGSQLLLYGSYHQKISWIFDIQLQQMETAKSSRDSSYTMGLYRHNWSKQQGYNPWWEKPDVLCDTGAQEFAAAGHTDDT